MEMKSGRSVLGLIIILIVSLTDHTSALRLQQNNVTLNTTVVPAEVDAKKTLSQTKQLVENSTTRSIKQKKAPTQGNLEIHVNSQNHSKKVVVNHTSGIKDPVEVKKVETTVANETQKGEQVVDMYVIAQTNRTTNESTVIHKNVSESTNVSTNLDSSDASPIAESNRTAMAQANVTKNSSANNTANVSANVSANTTSNKTANISANATKALNKTVAISQKNQTLNATEFQDECNATLAAVAVNDSSNETSLISIANSEQKSPRHAGKELLQANKDIIITAAENVSQTSDKKTAVVSYPKPIVPDVSQYKVQTLATQGKWVGDSDELTESNLKTAPTMAKLNQPKNLSNRTNAAKNQTVTVIPDPQPKDNQNIQTEEQKQTHHSVGRIVGKTQNAMIQRAIEAAGNASKGSNQTDVMKEMVQKEQIQVQEQAENVQNLQDASDDVERSNTDRMQSQIDEENSEEKKTLAAAKGKKNLSAKIGKNIAVASKKDTQVSKQNTTSNVGANHSKVIEQETPQQPKIIEPTGGNTASSDQTFQKLQQLDKQDAKQQALEVTDDGVAGDQEDLQLFQKVPKTELEAVEIQLQELEQIKLVAKKLKNLRDQRDEQKVMFDKAGGRLAQVRQDITENKHDLERMYRKAGIEKPAMV